jgi:carbon-monoxide dehydrogenase small subunit
VAVRKTLADFLREDVGLTGTHLGCEHGVCGACTIVMNGEAVRSCLLFAVQADGADLLTVEGLAQGEALHPLQAAFCEHHALQCGFCTPSFLLTLHCVLRGCAHPSEAELREAIAGNLCRSTAYQNIVRADKAAAEKLAATRCTLPQPGSGRSADSAEAPGGRTSWLQAWLRFARVEAVPCRWRLPSAGRRCRSGRTMSGQAFSPPARPVHRSHRSLPAYLHAQRDQHRACHFLKRQA